MPGVGSLDPQIRSPGFFGIAVNVQGQEQASFGKAVHVNGCVLSGENWTETNLSSFRLRKISLVSGTEAENFRATSLHLSPGRRMGK